MLFAANNDGMALMIPFVMVLATSLMFVSFVLLLLKYYKRCPSDQLLVIYGQTGKKDFLVIHGGAVFVWPLLQDYSFLSLEPLRTAVPKELLGRADALGVKTPANLVLAISTDDQVMKNAATRLLNLPRQEILLLAEDLVHEVFDAELDAIEQRQERNSQSFVEGKWRQRLEEGLNTVGLTLLSAR